MLQANTGAMRMAMEDMRCQGRKFIRLSGEVTDIVKHLRYQAGMEDVVYEIGRKNMELERQQMLLGEMAAELEWIAKSYDACERDIMNSGGEIYGRLH